jgi:phosphoribosylamine--glycine ligase
LARLITPLASLLSRAATGRLADGPSAQFSKDVAVTVVLASEGYPQRPAPDRPIGNLTEGPGVHICHASTSQRGDALVATGGRVLSVVATAASFSQARELAYDNISKIQLEGSHFRSDIAAKVSD